ncbi:CubicO group peptidase (beta-lactamase class C family) [Luteibacter jiangsuensis]|uniref:CubicO group peptidase (Beta-lactamase class C family) n=1 Tax=Luteibacter jiangsuensis TaxID=637577 RepID=A0ABT9SUS7_9GAMM|nr:serine hydrolase domain-containing protein [Luteibacter jiangsuensis]MDQ0008744.1 CubicO group peptidase (beta-lactamase class C family) [Luteibacter jiangsuensis]
MFRTGLLFSCLLLALPAAAADKPLRGAALDQRITFLMKEAKVPGLAVAIVEDGKVVSVKAYGQRDVEQGLPLTTDTVMYAASLTKAAFAYATMSLVDAGTLKLDASIAGDLPKPLPDFPKYADLAGDERWRRLTPSILLSHRTGFPNFRFWQPGKDYDPNGKLSFYFDPGTRFGYSGEGINLMQFVLENGKSIDVDTLMKNRLFQRYGMTRTSMTWRDDFAENVAIGYDEEGKPLGHKKRESVRAAGSMDTTITDYAHLLAAMSRGDGLKAATYRTWLKPVVRIRSVRQFPTIGLADSHDNDSISLGYAIGVGTFESPRGPAFFKEGHDDGTNNLFVCLERSKTCVLLMSNSSRGESIFAYLLDDVLGKTCFPWYWNSYIPYDRPELRSEPVVPDRHPACAI